MKYKYKKIYKNLFYLHILIVFLLFLFFYHFFYLEKYEEKTPLTESMTYINQNELKIDINKNISLRYEYENAGEYEQKNSQSKNFEILSPTLYFVILLCSIPIIILIIVLTIPSKKISDNLIALDLDKNKSKRNKQKLGVQQKPFKLDDDNL